MRNVAMLPGPPALWLGERVAGPAVTIGADDVAQWSYTVFLMSSYSFFMSFGLGRGVLEKAHPRYLRLGRPISVSAVPFGPGIDISR